MREAIDGPDEMSTAPRIITMKIPVDKIGEVIGPKGKVINQIQDDTGARSASRTTDDLCGRGSGRQGRGSTCHDQRHCQPDQPGEGERYLGTVVKITAFGACFAAAWEGRLVAHLQDAHSPGDKESRASRMCSMSDRRSR